MYFFLRTTVQGSHTVMRANTSGLLVVTVEGEKHTQVHLSLGRLLIVFVDTGPERRTLLVHLMNITHSNRHTHSGAPLRLRNPTLKMAVVVVVDNNRTAPSQPYINKHCILEQSETETFRTINVNAVHLYAKRFVL